jgi:hypothetical protein
VANSDNDDTSGDEAPFKAAEEDVALLFIGT